jgi:hypothetical protein
MMRKILSNLWFWVITAFVLVIVGWYFTVKIANQYRVPTVAEGEIIERQVSNP